MPMFLTAELLANFAVHRLPCIHHSFACHSFGGRVDGGAADDDAVPVSGCGTGATADEGDPFGATATSCRYRFPGTYAVECSP